ncbi:MAG: rhodanese-like domain-containing protein [Moraxellaceae bacterium]|nr:rhodanese-like domain-containing protein [Moraxellaceae bacterium]
MTRKTGPATLRQWLNDGDELALLDVREPGQFGEGHAFFAINLPYSRLEADAPARLPRRDVRIVLIGADDADDTHDGVAERAASRLQEAGYTDIHILEGGAAAWPQSGCALFKGVNLPSKTFGELVEQVCHTPHLSAAELQQRLQDKAPLLLVDGRTPAEHRKMAIPGALPVPNGELALRVPTLLADTQTPVVVHCAGRTRSIIGAQTLRHVGLPNPVIALENGTQGWRLAGLELEHDSPREIPDVDLAATHDARREGAHRYAQRAGVTFLDAAAAQAWLDDPTRSSYAFDIRTAAEYAAGTLPGAQHAPGGQLIQATDQYVAVRPARILVLDDEGIRAPIVAAWLSQLGFEAAVVEGGIHTDLRLPAITPTALPVSPTRAQASTLRELAQAGVPVLDLRPSLAFRKEHLSGSPWTTRARVRQHTADTVVLIADDEVLAALAARDLQEAGTKTVLLADWQTALESGLPREATPDSPSDAEAIDYLFFVHDRHDGNLDAARRYLEWETGLLAQCTEDELRVFKPLPQA